MSDSLELEEIAPLNDIQNRSNLATQNVNDVMSKLEIQIVAENLTKLSSIIELIKRMSIPISLKIKVKHKLCQKYYSVDDYLNFTGEESSFLQLCRYSFQIKLRKLKHGINNIIAVNELWYYNIKSIEGHFGNAMVAFFKFHGFICMLNLIPLVICSIFLIVPQFIQKSVVVNSSKDVQFSFIDIISGEGIFNNSLLYYNYYTSNMFQYGIFEYSLSKAYLLTVYASHLIIFIILFKYTTSCYRRYFIESRMNKSYKYSKKIFCNLDFSINSTETANLKQEIFRREIEELLEDNHKEPVRLHSCFNQFYFFSRRLIINYVVIALTICFSFVFHRLSFVFDSEDFKKAVVVPLFATISITLLIRLSVFIVRFENYRSHNTRFYVSMSRTFFISLIGICTYAFYWIIPKLNNSECWESKLGKMLYQLIVTFTLISTTADIIEITLKNVRVKLFTRCVWNKIEFNIELYALNLIFCQMLFWFGLHDSPGLSYVVYIIMLLNFHIKKFTLVHLCSPVNKVRKSSSQIQTICLMLTFVGYVFATTVNGYIAFTKFPSKDCGPFSNVTYAFEVLMNSENGEQLHKLVGKIINFLNKPGVYLGIILILTANAYLIRKKASMQEFLVLNCENMLALQKMDKKFLTDTFSKISSNIPSHSDIDPKDIIGGLKGIPGTPRKKMSICFSEHI